jgi:ADP-ribose pyrophosphatase YjhB (NUDIX family)
VLKSHLYRLLKRAVSLFFNILNLLLAGNLPPFGCVCVIVEDGDKYLVVQRPEGGYVFPGGFMRWREHPVQTALRECEEETGLRLKVNNLVGYSSTISNKIDRMSTLTVIYQAEVAGGELRSSIEGRPCWKDKTHLQKQIHPLQKGTLEHFLQYREQSEDGRKFHVEN